MKNKIFDNVYPFTTEEIASYFPLLDLKEKNVLTVGHHQTKLLMLFY